MEEEDKRELSPVERHIYPICDIPSLPIQYKMGLVKK